MKKSEKILLGVLAVVLLWAGYILLLDPKSESSVPEGGAGAYKTQLETMRQDLEKSALTEKERRIVALLGEHAQNRLFYAADRQFYFTDGEAFDTGDEEAIVYSGYLQAGNAAFAIINGIEYSVGDQLAVSGYRVKRIAPGFVTVEHLDPNTGRAFERRIPLAEDGVDDVSLKAVY